MKIAPSRAQFSTICYNYYTMSARGTSTTKKLYQNSGFIALISILVITAVSIIIGTTVTLKAISHATMSASEMYSAQAWASANGCVETAVAAMSYHGTSTWDLATSTSYKGDETISVGGIPCYIAAITATGSDSRLIRASSTASSFVRKLQVIVATNTPQTVISSWQEVGDF